LFEFGYCCLVIGYLPFDLIRRPEGKSNTQKMLGYWNLTIGYYLVIGAWLLVISGV